MPTVFSHIAVPLALRAGLGGRAIPRPLVFAGMAASVIPDLDVIGYHMGVAYGSQFGHRGATHSIAFSLAMGAVAALFSARLRAKRSFAFLFVAACGASHGLLDSLTDGGSGIAFWWPLSDERFFAPWRPIEVSPLSAERFLSHRGLVVLGSELVWVWLPAALFAAFLLALRKRDARAPSIERTCR
jgi:inner membrane protein